MRTAAELAWPLESSSVAVRAAALGDACVAAPGDVDSLFYNPAGLAEIPSPQVALHHHEWLDGIRQDAAAFTIPFHPLGALGFAAQIVDYGAVESRDTEGVLLGESHPRRYNAALAWGQRGWKGFSAGGSLKFGAQDLGGTPYTSVSTDLGALWAHPRGIRAGICYYNWGNYVKTYLLDSVWRAGVSYERTLHPDHRALFALSGAWEPSGSQTLQAGVEDLLFRRFALRAGWRLDLQDDLIEGLRGLTAGFGLHVDRMRLDYAFQAQGEMGSSHRVGMTYRFREPAPPSPTPTPTATPTATLSSTPTSTETPSSTPSPTSTLSLPSSTTPHSSLLTPHFTWTPTLWVPGTDLQDPARRENLKLYFKLPEDVASEPVSADEGTRTAILEWQKRISSNASDAEAWMELGRLYAATGERELALQCFDQVLRLKPDLTGLRSWLEGYRRAPTGR